MKHSGRRVPTLLDVALQAGVDASTVSRVLNGSEGARVSDSARLRILEAATVLNYRPNSMARGLRTARSRTVGLIVPEINSPVFAEIIAGATSVARAHDYTLLIGEDEEASEGEPLYTKLASANQIDGLIIAPRHRDEMLVRRLGDMRIPVVVAHSKVHGIPYCVTIDSFNATKKLITYLLGLGHRRIVYLARRGIFYNDIRRLAGFRAALRAAGISPDGDLIMHTPHTFEDARANMSRLIKTSAQPPTAIFTVSLIAAAGAMKALEQAGLRVPDEVSVVSLYDNEFAKALTPPITAMSMPREKVGNTAARIMIELLEGHRPTLDNVLEPGDLMERASTAPPPGDRTGSLR